MGSCRTSRWFVGFLGISFLLGCESASNPEPADIDGSWELTVNTVCEGAIVIEQNNRSFNASGWIGGEDCPYFATGEGTGSINGNSISFGVLFGEGSDETGTALGGLQFSGSVAENGEEMSGTWSAQGLSGPWTAVRTQIF